MSDEEGLDSAAPDVGPGDAMRARTRKAPDAFRTISEVADELHVPQHVLRFWETKFPRIKPLKRGGGWRYYRPDDVFLLRRIADLLYTQGYTIKGVQRLLKDGGGALTEDIPPASPEEQQEAAAELARLRDAVPAIPPRPPVPELVLAEPPRPSGARVVLRQKIDPETERLRSLLADTLAGLEDLRRLLA